MPIECSHTVMETVDSSSFILNDTSISYKSVFVQSYVQSAWLGKLQQQLAQSTKRPTEVMSMLCDIWNFRGIEQVYQINRFCRFAFQSIGQIILGETSRLSYWRPTKCRSFKGESLNIMDFVGV